MEHLGKMKLTSLQIIAPNISTHLKVLLMVKIGCSICALWEKCYIQRRNNMNLHYIYVADYSFVNNKITQMIIEKYIISGIM